MVTESIQSGGGGDYTTIGAWETASGTGDIGEIDDNSTYAENITIAGSTGRTLRAGASNHHDGTAGSGPIVDPSSNGHAFTVNEVDFTCEGLEITGLQATSNEAFRLQAASGFIAEKLIIHDLNTNQQDAFYCGDFGSTNTATYNMRNCIIYQIERGGIHPQGSDNKTVNVDNCTFQSCAQDGDAQGGHITDTQNNSVSTVNAVNCSFGDSQGTTTGLYGDDGLTINCTNCAVDTADITADGATDVSGNIESIVQADQFVSLTDGSEDFHLASGSDLEDAGTSSAVTDDIDYVTRTATFDIGADEFATAAAARTLYTRPVPQPIGMI